MPADAGRSPVLPNLVLALVAGLCLRHVVNLDPLWWLAWLAPAPLLLSALRSKVPLAVALVSGASLLGTSVNWHYYTLVMPAPAALAAVVAHAIAWIIAVCLSRRVVLRYHGGWTVLAYPVAWAALDTLMSHFLPDGNWNSLGHSQAGFLPAAQVVALAGVPGLVFVLCLFPSALALLLFRGWRSTSALAPAALALALACASLGLGALRLQDADVGEDVVFGLASIDDVPGPDSAGAIWAAYERHIATLAAQGAQVVVLPEKIALVSPQQASGVQGRLSAAAARGKVWLMVGLGVNDGVRKTNVGWLFDPSGRLRTAYTKRHLAPPERDFVPGNGLSLVATDHGTFGLAICKDMHFRADGLGYARAGASVMLVPAWDFAVDGRYAARLSALRGIENRFAMVRTAREGLLTITDSRGRIVAEAHSRPLPGATALGTVRVPAQVGTAYTRTGNLVGWSSVAGAAVFLALAWWPARRRIVQRVRSGCRSSAS